MTQMDTSRSLKVLIVSNNRAVQRQLSHFLDTAHYQVFQAADSHSAQAALEAHDPQILLLDADVAAWNEVCGLAAKRQPTRGVFTLLMVEEPDQGQLHDALESGVDDFLLKPLAYGEMLCRLRAGARVLEHDARSCQQAPVDALTRLASRCAFTARLASRLSQPGRKGTQVACLALDLDFFARISRLQGDSAADVLLQAVAQELTRQRDGTATWSYLGADRFCAMLEVPSAAAGAEWAEHVREELAAKEFEVCDRTWRLTASVGLSSSESATTAEELIEHALEAVRNAKRSGRNCLAKWNNSGADQNDLIVPNQLLEQSVAKDVMTPCTICLQSDEPVSEAIHLLRQTRADAIPVVDAEGLLVGIFEQGEIGDETHVDQAAAVRDCMTTDAPSFAPDVKLSSLLDFFTTDARQLAIVVQDGRPLGFVTCNGLLALSRTVTTNTFAAESPCSDTSEYLLVPDLRPLECEQTA